MDASKDASPSKRKEKMDKKRKSNTEAGTPSESKRSKPSEFTVSHAAVATISVVLTDDKPSVRAAPIHTKKRKKKRKKDRRVKTPSTSTAKEQENFSPPAESKALKGSDVEDDDSSTDGPVISFPFPTDPDDHCESPLQAYAHIQPLLSRVADKLKHGISGKDLSIYDPYFCNGAVIDNMKALGFPSVYNKKEDCYQVWSSSTVYPPFDALVTNPPYSGDHIEKLVDHITSPNMIGRPWFLLMPDWVHKKDYFVSKTKSSQMQPFYLVPKKRYVYLPPKDYRASKKSDVHKKSSPFNSMWYIWGGTRELNDQLLQLYSNKACTFPLATKKDTGDLKQQQWMRLAQACDLARSKSALRDLRRKHKK